MGVGFNFICKDCKRYYQLGYGSYGTWLYADTIEKYETLPAENKALGKNQNLEQCLRDHKGHNTRVLNMDGHFEKDKKLYEENPSPYNPTSDELIADLGDYERIELQ